MKNQLLITGIMLVFLVVGLSGCIGPDATEYFNKEYEANENTVLKATTLNGQIEVTAWDGDTVSFNAVKKSSFGQEELDNIEINVMESENQIEIEAKYIGQRTTTPSIDMNIKVPRNVTVTSVTTSNGAIQISGTKGNITAHSSNGDIIIEDVDGYVKAITSNGRIEIQDTTGIDDLETSNGRINAEIFDFKDDVDITSSNGKISVYINPSLNVDIEMKTSNGQISVSGISLNLTRSEEKHMEGKLGEGGNKIFIQTSNGDIALYKLGI